MNAPQQETPRHYEQLLYDDEALGRFIEHCEQNEAVPNQDLTGGILQRLDAALRAEERERFTRRRLFALTCFSSAACVLLMTVFNLFPEIARAFTPPAEGVIRFLEDLF